MVPAVGSEKPADLTLAGRLAGAFLLVNAVVLLLEMMFAPAASASALATGIRVSALFDLGLGIALVANKGHVLGVVIFRAIAGGLLFSVYQLTQDQYVVAVVQVAFSSALLLLLIDQAGAGTGRMVSASLLFAVYALAAGCGVYVLKTGYNPIGTAVLVLQRDIERPVVREVKGSKNDWSLQLPDSGWRSRRAERIKKDNAEADRWLILPQRDTHLMIHSEELPKNIRVDADLVTAFVIDGMKENVPDFETIELSPFGPYGGRLVHAKAKFKGYHVEYYVGVFADRERIYQVMGFAESRNFALMKDELKEAIGSFQIAR
jgi:hypothetical protein